MRICHILLPSAICHKTGKVGNSLAPEICKYEKHKNMLLENPSKKLVENLLENLVESSCRYEKHPPALSLHKTKEYLQL